MATGMNAFGAALYSKLSNTAALTSLLSGGTASPSVYEIMAPQSSDPPYVVFQAQAPSTPQRTLSGGTAYENALYTVKGVTESWSAASAGTIADKIDAALDNAALTVTGYTHMTCHRVQNVDYVEVVEGKRFNHRGAVYRLMADPA